MISSLFNKKTTACPYCYVNLDVNKVAFRCSGRGLPGRPACRPVTSSRRSKILDDKTPVMPSVGPVNVSEGERLKDKFGDTIDTIAKSEASCMQCGGSTSVRICPCCHSLLPFSLDNNSPLFGLIGVRNSGKTVMLSILHKELLRNVARRFNAAIDNPGGSSGLARDLDLFEQNMSQEGGRLPAQTAASGARKKLPAVYEWKYSRNRKTSATIFSFYDSAGEDISQQERALEQQYLGQASGMIMLLDPFSFPENIMKAKAVGAAVSNADSPETALDSITYLLQTENRVKRNKKIEVPLAIVVSKIDAFMDEVPPNHPLRQRGDTGNTFDELESQNIHDHMVSLIAHWGGDNLLRKLEENYKNFRIFGVSALGAEPDYKSSTVNSRGLLPHRVADPLLWLLADSGFIPKGKA
ncbi:hypothetical protein [Glutamicibacter sp. NPDC087344]|uniref:TRAFAC clade GTPase domain-containing protein n=1 Tax=Glutamicibacter sp. NPDC087344 TaxID=3363994 RepID=UPI003806DF5E